MPKSVRNLLGEIADPLVEAFLITVITAQSLHQQGNSSLALANHLQHPLVQVGTVIAAVALGDVNHASSGSSLLLYSPSVWKLVESR